MSPPVTYKIHIDGHGQINCTPNGGGGRFAAKQALSWESADGGKFILTFFLWDGTKTAKPAWPFVDAPPIEPNQTTTPFEGRPFAGVLKQVPANDEGVYAYSVSRVGSTTLDPIIVVDN